MPSDPSLRERFWRDVAIAAGHRVLDPRAIREAIQDMMRNYDLHEVPGFETDTEDALNLPDASNFWRHTPFTPVFSRPAPGYSALQSPWSCFNTARPIYVGPRGHALRRRRSRLEPRPPDHLPGGINPGIQAGEDQPAQPTPAANSAPSWYWPTPLPPHWTPHHYVWAFPNGHLAWSPHPQPNPAVPYPLGPWAAIALTGGHPLPGTMPQWTPGTWPPLDRARPIPIRLSPHIIPNPNNAHLPLIDWIVTKHPSTAKRLTANHVIVDMASVWPHTITDTEAHTVVVTCDVGYMSTLWGPIVVERNRAVTLSDLFEAIYTYFQVPLTYPEVAYICDLHPSNYRRLTDAYHERCRESAALPGWEAMQGFRRADVLGDRRYWWGVWISSRHGAWWLNLGLVNSLHRRGLHP